MLTKCFLLCLMIAKAMSEDSSKQDNRKWKTQSRLSESNTGSAPPSYFPFLPAVSYENEEYSPKASHKTYKFTSAKTPPPVFKFSGLEGQFVKMPPWLPYPVPDLQPTRPFTAPVTMTTPLTQRTLTFSFDFQSSHPNGLLMYLDDGGPRDYLEIALHHRRLRLRFKFGASRSVMLTTGDRLNDRRWHTVKLEITFPVIKISVDGNTTIGKASSMFGEFRSFIFLGGIPKTYKLQHLTLPSVYFDARFRGSLRRFAIDKKFVLPVGKEKVIQDEGSHLCIGGSNPCRNEGVCVMRGNIESCDCSGTPFQGEYCETTMSPDVATFRGQEWFSYDLTSHPLSSFRDEISLSFKTMQRNGLILHTGKSSDYVNLSIKNGALSLVVNLGSGAYEVLVGQVQRKFNDNKWHQVRIRRELKQVEVTVDQANSKTGVTQNDYTQLTLDDVFYVGGSPSTADLPGSSVVSNFMGCLKEVTYKNKDTVLQLSKLARNHDRRVRVKGAVEFACSDVEVYGPITFSTSPSYLPLRQWRDASRGMIALDFKTIEKHGLLLFAAGDAMDFFALEMYDGFLNVIINLGSGTKKIRGNSPRKLNDGRWHHVVVQREVKRIMFRIDSQDTDVSLEGQATNLDVIYPLYLGGADFENLLRREKMPKSLWTGVLQYGFVGCIRDVYIDSTGVDIQMLAKSQRGPSTDAVAPNCQDLNRKACTSSPCRNGGSCKEGWSRFICDCSSTAFKGKTCEESVITASFNGSQYLSRDMERATRTQTEEISFRFRTYFSVGRLLSTASNTTSDQFTIDMVKGGQIKLAVNLGQGPDNIFQGTGLNDGQWHTVRIWRMGRRLSLDVDGNRKGVTLSGGHTELQFTSIFIGMDPLAVAGPSQGSPPFIGEIQNLIFNSKNVIDNRNNWGEGRVISNPITFKDKTSYVAIDTLNAYSSMSLYFTMRTTVTDGLLLYNAGHFGDFVAVELVSGFIHYVFNLGNGAQILSTPNQPNVCDNKWHDIRITRSPNNVHILSVDDAIITHEGLSVKRNLDLNGPLYIGGAREDVYFNDLPAEIASRTGYQGCLASFDLNGVIPNVLKSQMQSAGTVLPGCQGPFLSCRKSSCRNSGVCQQQWDSFTCDCSMTRFVGKFCEQSVMDISGKTTYLFRSENGMIVFSWPENSYPSSRTDNLSVGFATRSRNAVIAKVQNSATSSIKDYLQLAIEKGKLTLRFNTGNKDVVLVEPIAVSDGQYHNVQVRRTGMNGTMRVDNWPERFVAPTGVARARFSIAVTSVPPSIRPKVDAWLRRKEVRNTVFNSQSTIQIGGLLDDASAGADKATKILQPFRGQMMGVFFNDIRVFQLAVKGQDNIQIVGDVTLIGQSNGESPMFPAPGSISFYSSTLPNDVINPTTTMATLTTFSTTTRATREVNETDNDDDDCTGKEICGAENSKANSKKPPKKQSSLDGDKLPEDKTGNKSRTDVTLNDGILKDGKAGENIDYGNNGSGNIFLDDKKTKVIGGVTKGTVGMVCGIVGAAVLCVFVLFVVMLRYKQRVSYPDVPVHQNNHKNNSHQSNNNMNSKSKLKSAKIKKSDKEYYV